MPEADLGPAPLPPSVGPAWGGLVCSPPLLGRLGEGSGLLSNTPHPTVRQSSLNPVAGRHANDHSGSMAASTQCVHRSQPTARVPSCWGLSQSPHEGRLGGYSPLGKGCQPAGEGGLGKTRFMH